MGDSGSLMIGMVNAILVIKFINVAHDPFVAIPVHSSVAFGFAVLIVPLLDTLRVFSVRILNAKSPFTPDRNHVHHLFLDRGLSHAAVTFSLVLINIGFIALAWLGQSFGTTILLGIMLVLAFAGLGILYYYRRTHKTMVVSKTKEGATLLTTTTKVLDLTKEMDTEEKRN